MLLGQGAGSANVTKANSSPEKVNTLSAEYARLLVLLGGSSAATVTSGASGGGDHGDTSRKTLFRGTGSDQPQVVVDSSSGGAYSFAVGQKDPKTATLVTAADDDQFEGSLADAASYGTLASSWVACIAYDVFAELEADGKVIPAAVRAWAVSGCTSALVEVNTWVDDSSEAEVERVEEAVVAVELQGCADCYSYIASPEDSLMVLNQ